MTPPPDPFWLAERIVAGEHVNGWSVAARMLAGALLEERAGRTGEKKLFDSRVGYLADLLDRVRSEAAAVPSREAALQAEIDLLTGELTRLRDRQVELRTLAAALSDRIVDVPAAGLILEYGSREAVNALRSVLDAD